MSYYWFESDIAAFAVSIFLSGLLIPQILRIAHFRKLFDDVSSRKVHRGVVPRLGGIAFFPSSLFALCFVVAVNLSQGDLAINADFRAHGISLLYLSCAGILLFLVGIADDLIGVRYRAKFIIQIMSAMLVIVSGTDIPSLGGLCWIWDIPDVVSWFLTGFLVVFVVNSINLIDGIDGLATGLSIIALLFYAVILYLGGWYLYSLLACATMGTLLAFFYFNVFGSAERGKKIFMGDTGSLTVGVILAFLGIAVSSMPEDVSPEGFNPFVLAYSPLVIPAFDVVRVYLHRVQKKRNPFLPDKSHIHHKLLALGYNQHGALAIILTVSVVFLTLNVLLSQYIQVTFIVAFDVLIWTFANIWLTKAIKAREQKIGHTLYD